MSDATPPRTGLSLAALIVACLGLAAAAGGWFINREQTAELKLDLARRLASVESLNRQAELAARNADQLARQLQDRVAQIESQTQTTREQQLALEALYKEMSQDRDQWILAELEQLLLTASEQLQLAGDVSTALAALEVAEARLTRYNRPQYATLREAITADMARLRITPQVDRSQLAARLNALLGLVPELPLAGSPHINPAIKPVAAGTNGLWQELLAELRSIVQIRRLDPDEPALLAPDQTVLLREGLQLRLLGARLALLQRDGATYKTDLLAAQTVLERYFDRTDPMVQQVRREVGQLADYTLNSTPPDLKASLAALAHYKRTDR
jgi:uncharacterized protein HemX